MIVVGHHNHYETPDGFATALLGCRVRIRFRRGEPFQGTILHARDNGLVIVALDDGAFVKIDIEETERLSAITDLLDPYRSAPHAR